MTPLSYYGGRPITDGEAAILHSGPPKGIYTEQNFSHIKRLLNNKQENDMSDQHLKFNSLKSGVDREVWIEELAKEVWLVTDSCINGPSQPACPKLPSCQTISWSSLSPDPKSEIGPMNKETGRIR